MKKFIVFLTVCFSFTLANAQYIANDNSVIGDGDNPYVGTSYTYTVTADGGTSAWEVYSASNPVPANIVTAGPTTYTISGASTASATITWNAAGTYYLNYKETSTNGCVTRRGLVVIAAANTLVIAAGTDASTCNTKEGQVLNWSNYDESTDLVKTALTFPVTLTKDATFNADSLQFTGTLTLPSGVTVAAAGDITIDSGRVTVSGGSNTSITVEGCPISSGATSVTVTVTVNVSSTITTGGNVILTLANKKVISGNGNIETSSNGGDNAMTNQLKDLPGATNISFN
jgi:hypothetical protein